MRSIAVLPVLDLLLMPLTKPRIEAGSSPRGSLANGKGGGHWQTRL